MDALLLLVAFRHRIQEPEAAAGLVRFQEIAGRSVDEGEFRTAVARAVAAGDLLDPVRLPLGALHCHWHLELTPKGVNAVRALLHAQDRTADELILEGSALPQEIFGRVGR